MDYLSPFVAWVELLRGLPGLGGSKYSLRRPTCYVCHNFYMGCVGQKCFLRGSIFLQGAKLLQASFFLRVGLRFSWK